jgi:hypothetical protein
MRAWLAALVIVGMATAAGAQVRVQPNMTMARPPAAGMAAGLVDPTTLLQSRVTTLVKRVRGLEGRMSTLEEMLRQSQARSSFTCVDGTTSRNGSGASEDCTPYACNYMDGRCRTVATSSDRCAPGFFWVEGNRCVPPSPGNPDD